MVGTVILQYKILEKVGEGGMGVVYKAQDTKLDRTVALKFLPPHLSASEQDKARFVQEAKAAATLNHPNVCTIHDILEHEGRIFIVMEFVEGQTLRERFSSINQHKAIDIGIQVAEGLSAAHEKGIVHRDIKPENIMIRKDGIAQIMDFGLAKLRAGGSKITRLTKEGSTVGTAGYMSPEQVQGQESDHRSDIFSLGVMLYEMFTGELPFKGVHESALMYEIVNVDPPPMSAVRRDVGPELDRIVFECLQKDPDERYNAVKDVAKDLKRFKRESSRTRMSRTFPALTTERAATAPAAQPPAGVEAARPAKTAAKPALWIAAAFAAGVIVTGLFWRPWSGAERQAPSSMQFTVKLPDSASIPIGFSAVDISPDGKFMSFIIQSGAQARLMLRPTDRDVLEPVAGSDIPLSTATYFSAFSADGQWIAYAVNTLIRKVSVFGGAAVTVGDAGGAIRGMRWGADGNIYYGVISGGVYRINENGGTPEQITQIDSTAGEISHRFPDLLPGGNGVLYTVKFNTISSFEEAAIAAYDMKSRSKKVLIRGGAFARYVPTGHLVYVRGSSVFAVPFDAGKMEVTGPPKQLFRGGWMNPFSGDANFAFSRDGILLYVPRGIEFYSISKVKWIDMHGNLSPLIDTANSYYAASLSPDGQKVAVHIQQANDDIWLYHIVRKSMTRLTFGDGNNGFPVWSPDGKYLYYTSEHRHAPNLYRRPWDGSGSEERLTTSSHFQLPKSISRDGKYLTFVQDGDIWLLSLDGSGKTSAFIHSAATKGNPVFSPDGRYLAYESNESGKYEVVIVPFPSLSGKWQVSSGGGTNPIWSPSGNEIYYTQGSTVFGVTIHPGSAFDYSSPRNVLELPPDGTVLSGISNDGGKFALIVLPWKDLSTPEFTLITNWFQVLRNTFATQ